jgi:hypothetical protein
MMSKKNEIYSVRETWIEQKGGLLLSIFIHLVLFSFMITKYPEFMIPKNIPNPISLLLKLSYESNEKEVTSFTPAQSTFQENKGSENASSETQEENQEGQVEKLTYPEQGSLPEYRVGIEEMENDLTNSMSDLHSAIERRSLNTKGIRADGFNSAGAEEGVVRILDIGNVPGKISDQVLQKYRIRITKKFISGDNNVFFLNKVQVQDKTFISGSASGYYEVFEIPMEAVKKMTMLEGMEFSRRKLDPSRTRVKKVVFGIIQIDGDYDLGITAFEFEEIN